MGVGGLITCPTYSVSRIYTWADGCSLKFKRTRFNRLLISGAATLPRVISYGSKCRSLLSLSSGRHQDTVRVIRKFNFFYLNLDFLIFLNSFNRIIFKISLKK
jgi:hypothetical protein